MSGSLSRCLVRPKCLAVALTSVLMGCGGGVQTESLTEDVLAEVGELGQAESGMLTGNLPKPGAPGALPLTPVEDPLGAGPRAAVESRIVITSAAGYQRYFGHPAPSSVHFASGEAIIFYAAGVQNTGGYEARIPYVSLSADGTLLQVSTQLVEPGPDCGVTQALTHPYVLAKVKLPPATRWVRWSQSNIVRICSAEYNPCAATLCEAGTTCQVQEVQCVTHPCEPIAVCVPSPNVMPPAGGECGKNICGEGTVCCNASCGICAPPGSACLKIGCE